MIDGAAENQFDGAVEPKNLRLREKVGGDGGIDSAVEERLIGIDVADAGQDALIEQGGLDGPAGPGKALGELSGADLQRLWAEVFVICLTTAQPPDAAKASRIAETKLGGICDLRLAICD